MPPPPANVFMGATLALATSLVASFSTAATKYVADLISIEQIVTAQYLICVAVMLPSIHKRGYLTLKTSRPWLHLFRGTAGWLCFYTYYLALNKIPLVDASLLRNTAPICVPVLLFFWKGFRILFYYFSFSALCSLPLAITHWQHIPLRALPFLMGIGLSIWLVMWLYTSAYSYASAYVIAPISYTGVLFTGFLGWYIWNQTPDTLAISGAFFIISGGIGSVFLGREIHG